MTDFDSDLRQTYLDSTIKIRIQNSDCESRMCDMKVHPEVQLLRKLNPKECRAQIAARRARLALCI